MNTHNKIQWLLGLTAGAAMLALAAGCQTTDRPDAVAHGEDFVPNDSVRSIHEFVELEAANSARADATLRQYHFDASLLNSLGEQRLDSILRNGDSTNPLVIYLDLPADDLLTTDRQKAVTAFLKDRGLTEDQIKLKSGPNPDVNSPVAPLLAAQAAGAAGGSPPAAPSAPH